MYSDLQVQHPLQRLPAALLISGRQTIGRQGFEIFFRIQQINLQEIDFANIMQHRANGWFFLSRSTYPLLSLSRSPFQLYLAGALLIISITINGVCFVLGVIPLGFVSISIFLKIGYVFIFKTLKCSQI